MKRQVVPMLVAGAALLSGPGPAAGADRVVLRLHFPPRAITMADGRVVYSQYETRNEVSRPRLYAWKRGVTKRLPIVLDEGSWAIDLGRNARGHQVLTYSFCRIGCGLYEYEFSSGRKRRLRFVNHGYERDPTRWGRYLAWTRTPDPLYTPEIFIKRLPNGRAHRLPGSPKRPCHEEEGHIVTCDSYGGWVREIDLRRGRVAYTWSAERPRRRNIVAVRMIDRRGRSHRVSAVNYGENYRGLPWYFSPRFGAGRLLAGLRGEQGSRPRNSLITYSGGRGRRKRAPDTVLAVGPFGRRTAYFVARNYYRDTLGQDGCPCEVRVR